MKSMKEYFFSINGTGISFRLIWVYQLFSFIHLIEAFRLEIKFYLFHDNFHSFSEKSSHSFCVGTSSVEGILCRVDPIDAASMKYNSQCFQWMRSSRTLAGDLAQKPPSAFTETPFNSQFTQQTVIPYGVIEPCSVSKQLSERQLYRYFIVLFHCIDVLCMERCIFIADLFLLMTIIFYEVRQITLVIHSHKNSRVEIHRLSHSHVPIECFMNGTVIAQINTRMGGHYIQQTEDDFVLLNLKGMHSQFGCTPS